MFVFFLGLRRFSSGYGVVLVLIIIRSRRACVCSCHGFGGRAGGVG